MSENQTAFKQINQIVYEIYKIMDLLYFAVGIEEKNRLLNELGSLINKVVYLLNELESRDFSAVPALTDPTLFTRSELLKYDGKNGNPAYVAVNGVVYDVTNSAAWAAATHFGLAAGRDYTREFSACHAGQNVLDRLKTVGRLTDG